MDESLVISLWEGDLRDQVAETTASEYRRYVHHLRRWLDVPLLEAEQLQLKAWLADHDWSPATRHYALRALRHFYRWLADEHLLAANPTANIKTPKVVETALLR
jgi:site-specific recombinase XerD